MQIYFLNNLRGKNQDLERLSEFTFLNIFQKKFSEFKITLIRIKMFRMDGERIQTFLSQLGSNEIL